MLSIPAWISTQSYVIGRREGMSIISNQKSHKILLLVNESSVIWSWIESGLYTEIAALDYLQTVGSENPREDLAAFLEGLLNEECLTTGDPLAYVFPEGLPVPEGGGASSITPAASEEDKALEDEVASFAENHGFLFSAFWEVTNRCNEKCVHCFNPGAPHAEGEKARRDTEELSTEDGLKLIKSFRDAGAYRLILSGGEVFLRRDIFDLIAYARSLRMQVHLFTNGIMLDDERLEKLAQLYPESVSISLYSASPEIHDSVTRVPGSFEKSVWALQKLRDLHIKTTIKAIQMAHTIQGYANLDELAQSLGARTTVEVNMSAGNDGAQGPVALAVANESELVAMAVTPGSPIFVGDASNNFGERKRSSGEIFCSAGQSMLSVTSDGNIYPCVALPLKVGNIAQQDVRDIWNLSTVGRRQGQRAESETKTSLDPLSKWQEIRVGDYDECGTHERCGWCNKCPGMSINETGNVLSASSVQCRIASARMRGAKLLKAGADRAQILSKLGVSDNFGRDPGRRPIPEAPIRFVSQREWLTARKKS